MPSTTNAAGSTGGGLVIGWENVPGVLSTTDNAFGCFLAALSGADAPLVPPKSIRHRWKRDKNGTEFFGWTDAGLVVGPRRAAAWRVLDSQYFGLAQRRERVFVVASPLDGPDPAEILLEQEGLRRDSPPRREARQDVAGTLGGISPNGSWRFGADEAAANQLVAAPLTAALGRRNGQPDCGDTAGHLIAFGGNNTSGPIDVATALNASHTASGRQDFETETFVAHVAPALDASYGRLYGQDNQHANAGYGLFVAHTLRAKGHDGSEDGTGRGVPLVVTALRARPGAKGVDSDATDTLVPAVFGAMTGNGDAHGGFRHGDGLVPVSFRVAGDGAAYHEGDCVAPLTTGTDPSASVVALTCGNRGVSVDQACAGMAVPDQTGVRRLMPPECERLQGFPDGYTLVEVRGRPATDSPRYESLGNSQSAPVIAWIGERIERALARRNS